LAGCGPVVPPAGIPTESIPSSAPVPVAPAPPPIEIVPPAEAPIPLYSQGATGPDIVEMENGLVAIGCKSVDQNGTFTALDQRALNAFKKYSGIPYLPPTTNYGPITKEALEKAVASNATYCGLNRPPVPGDNPNEPIPPAPAPHQHAPAQQNPAYLAMYRPDALITPTSLLIV